jgi:hypothetical protein
VSNPLVPSATDGTKSELLTPEHDRPGTTKPDFDGPHYQFRWRAQYDSLKTGAWVDQLDRNGMSRSIAWLDPSRVVRIELHPTRDLSKPILEVRANLAVGETCTKWWQCEKTSDDPTLIVREVLTLDPQGRRPYLVYDWQENRVTLSTAQDL